MDLIHVWLCLVGLVVILYVILDGFSLGVGLLFLFAHNEDERDALMNSIAPVWDANQTWIVFGGGALFASFPLIYTVLFSALYIPLLTFLFGLIFRGLAFEFRAASGRKGAWNKAFFGGSLIATVSQGIVLGAYLSGIQTDHGLFSGGTFDWLNGFSVMTGIALVAGYCLLGSTYLILKTTGDVQHRAFRQAFWSAVAVAFFMVVVSIWTPVHDPSFVTRWMSEPRVYVIWVFPVMGLIAMTVLFIHLKKQSETIPFISSLFVFLSAYAGLQAAIYPYAILPSVTLYDAAAQTETLKFTLWGVFIVLPVVLAYIIHGYWVFRGKVAAGSLYH
ncbi:MAG: cytochrome d ubiquinol oxidase subunit II [Desulfatirhabdiaceae bacterium]